MNAQQVYNSTIDVHTASDSFTARYPFVSRDQHKINTSAMKALRALNAKLKQVDKVAHSEAIETIYCGDV